MTAYSGFKILKLFHPTAMVGDLWAVHEFYAKVFGVKSQTIPYTDASRAYRSLTVIADCCIENISPEQTHMSQFRMFTDILGNHWYFPCFYIDDMQDAIYHVHHRHGVRLTESGTGNPVVGVTPGGSGRSLVFTNPTDTGIMWEFYEGSRAWWDSSPLADPRMKTGWSLPSPAADDPVAVEALSHQTVVARDTTRIIRFLVEICGGRIFAEGKDEALGSDSTWITVGDEPTVFEIAVPTREGPRARDLGRSGNIVHSLTFKVRDIGRLRTHLNTLDIRVEQEKEGMLVTDPSSSLGLPFGFTQNYHPADPRSTKI
jgi:hypothetical protein